MNEPTLADEAELRQQMRAMYKKVGYLGSLQCLYEMMFSCNVLIDVITEENTDEKEKRV